MPVRAKSLPAPLRRVLESGPVEPLVSTLLRARLVRPAVAFFLREEMHHGRNRVAAYRLRGSGMQVMVEHGTPDVLVLDEVFYQDTYRPPAEVAARLSSAGPLRVLDVGANIGMFGLWLLQRRPAAFITAIEPDPRNAAVHRRMIERNGLSGSWTLIEAAASTRDGTVEFNAGEFVTSRVGAGGSHQVQAVDVFPLLEQCDVLKLDAEGAEWDVVLDPRFREAGPPLLAMEYHPWRCPEQDARAAALAALEGAGYEVAEIETTAPEGFGSVWAWRP